VQYAFGKIRIFRRHSLADASGPSDYEEEALETLTYFQYPSNHWRQIRTNNPLQRIIREIRRRARVVGRCFWESAPYNALASTIRRNILG